MVELSIFYPHTIGLFANGVYSGLGLCMNGVNVPSIRATSDPLPVFYKTYNNGSRIAISSIITSTVANALCYYRTKDTSFIYAAVLSFVSMPFTLLFIVPVNNQLFAMEKQGKNCDRQKVNALIDRWNKLQYFRTTTGIAAFVISVIYKTQRH